MAAPTKESEKLTKYEKKLNKRLQKSKMNLKRQDNIDASDAPTNILCVFNMGLDTGVSREKVVDVFGSYGDIHDVIMLPKKPYSFVCFTSIEEATLARTRLNGSSLPFNVDGLVDSSKIYISYVDRVPKSVLPSSALPPGLILLTDFITPEYEHCLLDAVNITEENSDNTLKHRRVKHFGYEFRYDINDVDPDDPLPQEIPVECHQLLDRIIGQGLVQSRPDQLTVNQYEPGQGIPPHVDTSPAFEDGIISLSLGSQTVMDFRHPDKRQVSVLLPRRSLLIMTGESRYIWSHGITPRKSDIVEAADGGQTLVSRETRTSFTFRKVIPTAKRKVVTAERQIADIPGVELTEGEACQLEQQHVHQVYEEIASHFSSTRHTPWPKISEFIMSLAPGSILADIGCGNGKYLGINKDIYHIGTDRSFNLAEICRDRNHEAFVSDILKLPLRSNSCDVCLCIAVIHHLSTWDRRFRALCELLRILRVGGKALIYVWAMEQELHKVKSKYLKKLNSPEESSYNQSDTASSKRLINESSTDVDIKFKSTKKKEEISSQNSIETLHTEMSHVCSENQMSSCTSFNINNREDSMQRTEGNSSRNCEDIILIPRMSENAYKFNDEANSLNAITPITEGISDMATTDTNLRSSSTLGSRATLETSSAPKLGIHVNRTQFKQQDMLVPWQRKEKKSLSKSDDCTLFHRFYHVFKQGELEALCNHVAGIKIVQSYYDQGNWCVLLQKVADNL